jgi:hypothetical protein
VNAIFFIGLIFWRNKCSIDESKVWQETKSYFQKISEVDKIEGEKDDSIYDWASPIVLIYDCGYFEIVNQGNRKSLSSSHP